MIRLAVRVHRAQSELVLAELLELIHDGVEEVQVDRATVEYAVYGAPGELPSLPELDAAVGDALVEVRTTEVSDDWHERWRRFHRSVVVDAARVVGADRSRRGAGVPAVRVRPPWEASSDLHEDGVTEIVIDPGMAFGTGAHASARLCLELLLGLAARERAGWPLLDVGTGSGVLAIAAARLGFSPVVALDHDRESVRAARANAAANDVEIEVRRLDLRAQALPLLDASRGEAAPIVVVANLLRPLLLDLSRTLACPPAHLLAGGLLLDEVQQVARAFSDRLGLRERERLHSEEWAAVWLAAPNA